MVAGRSSGQLYWWLAEKVSGDDQGAGAGQAVSWPSAPGEREAV